MSSTRRDFLSAATTVGLGAALASRRAKADPSKQPLAGAMPPGSGPGAGELRSSPVAADVGLARMAVEAATKAGASYADARLVLWRRENVRVRDDHIRNVSRSNEYGIGIRVIADGAWGFAATPKVAKSDVVKAAKRAVAAAKASAPALIKPVELVSTPRVVGAWVSPHEIDPFSISIDDKAEAEEIKEKLEAAGAEVELK